MKRLALLVAIVSGIPDSRADDTRVPDLRARRLPFIPRLRMRLAQVTPPPAAPAPAAADTARRPSGAIAPITATAKAGAGEPSLVPDVHAQLVLGFAVDGAEPSERGLTLAGNQIGTADDDAYRRRIGYDRARAYAFGDAFLGAGGLGAQGISAYLASQFRIVPTLPRFAPVPTAWDTSDDFQLRAGWAEADGIFDRGPLKTLVLRVGRQHIYGPGMIAHADGMWASWVWRTLRVAAYTGSRVPDWYEPDPSYPEQRAQRGLITGAEVTLDLRESRLPVQVRVRAMAFDNHGHSDATLDWAARRDLTLSGTARLFDGAIGHEHVTIRYRVSERTRLVVDGDYRHRRDPIWDYAFYDANEAGAARRYLDRGPSVPRAYARGRAGTVLVDNIDVVLHGAFAVDPRLGEGEVSYHAAGFLETGGALEIRVRRAFILGVQGLYRAYRHSDPMFATRDDEGVSGPLELPPENVGERNLMEGGMVARFSGGARKFSASAEIFFRRTRWAELYRDDGVPDPQEGGAGDLEQDIILGEFDLRGGGRVSFDAWVTRRLRLRAEYDISSTIDVAPEIRGLKSLRVLAEGQF